jgi:hypothetical protein
MYTHHINLLTLSKIASQKGTENSPQTRFRIYVRNSEWELCGILRWSMSEANVMRDLHQQERTSTYKKPDPVSRTPVRYLDDKHETNQSTNQPSKPNSPNLTLTPIDFTQQSNITHVC